MHGAAYCRGSIAAAPIAGRCGETRLATRALLRSRSAAVRLGARRSHRASPTAPSLRSRRPQRAPAPSASAASPFRACRNLHCHAFQRGMAGLAERRGPLADSFWTWREVMYRFLARLSPDDVEAIAAFAYMEMLEAGFTTVGEFHYLHHDIDGRPYADLGEMANRIAAASAQTRIGLTLLPSFYAYGGFGGAPPRRRPAAFPQRSGAISQAGRADARRRRRPAAGAGRNRAALAARGDARRRCARVCQATSDGPIHIHAAEQVKEVDDSIAALGARPVQWLLDNAALDARWCLIHATHTTEPEIRALAASGAVVGALSAHRGVARRRHLRRRGLSGGRRTVRHRHQLQHTDRRRRRAAAIGVRAASGAACPQRDDDAGGGIDRATAVRRRTRRPVRKRLQRPIGALAVGLRADIVLLDGEHPDLASRRGDQWLDAWIFVAGRAAVKSVLVGGDVVVEAGRHRMRPAIEGRYKSVVDRSRGRMRCWGRVSRCDHANESNGRAAPGNLLACTQQEETRMANLDRPGMIELLGRLGAENDETVLQAARELHRKISTSGLTWEQVLPPANGDGRRRCGCRRPR